MTQPQDHPDINKNVHPPILALMFIILAFLLGWFAPLPFMRLPPVFLIYPGLALTIIGFLLGVGAFTEFSRAGTTLDPHGSVSQLVTTGVYRITRNPIYLGFLLLVIGIPLSSGFYWGIIVAPFFVTTLNRLVIEREEAYLEIKFNEQYTSYKSSVRRWL